MNMCLSQQRALHVLEYGHLKALPAYRRRCENRRNTEKNRK